MNWQNVTVTLGDLKPWERNPKTISKAHAKRLLEYWSRIGQFQSIAIGPGGEVYDGHQRLSVLLAAYGPGYQIDARQSEVALTDAERQELVIAAHVGTTGQFDWDALSGWDAGQLQEWGMDAETLQSWNTDATALREMLEAENKAEQDDVYSRKIAAPIYEPKGEKPELRELFDEEKAKKLIADIEAADIPQEEKDFLIIAARRHTVLNYKRIAEYYAHASEPVQRLMEDSALIIIDFNRAIELGYVKLSEEIAKLYEADYGDA